jgi:predicted nuclease with TOPRIM domain
MTTIAAQYINEKIDSLNEEIYELKAKNEEMREVLKKHREYCLTLQNELEYSDNANDELLDAFEELLNHLAWLTEYVDKFGFNQMFDPDISDTILFAKTKDLITKYRG